MSLVNKIVAFLMIDCFTSFTLKNVLVKTIVSRQVRLNGAG